MIKIYQMFVISFYYNIGWQNRLCGEGLIQHGYLFLNCFREFIVPENVKQSMRPFRNSRNILELISGLTLTISKIKILSPKNRGKYYNAAVLF